MGIKNWCKKGRPFYNSNGRRLQPVQPPNQPVQQSQNGQNGQF